MERGKEDEIPKIKIILGPIIIGLPATTEAVNIALQLLQVYKDAMAAGYVPTLTEAKEKLKQQQHETQQVIMADDENIVTLEDLDTDLQEMTQFRAKKKIEL